MLTVAPLAVTDDTVTLVGVAQLVSGAVLAADLNTRLGAGGTLADTLITRKTAATIATMTPTLFTYPILAPIHNLGNTLT
jgi:hypothetical protein